MLAARYHSYGPPEILLVEEAPEPHAGPGEVRVRASAASVNPIDWKVRAGWMRESLPVDFPAIPSRDVAGIVAEVGEGVEGVATGDRVWGLDGCAEHVVLSVWASIPSAWSRRQRLACPP